MNKAEIVDCKHTKSGKAIKVDGGAIWSEVDRVAMAHGMATSSSNYSSCGVAA